MPIAAEQLAPNPPPNQLPRPGKQEPQRNGQGKYKITLPDGHQKAGQIRGYTRVSTILGVIEDTIMLHEWDQRHVAKGVAIDPELIDLLIGCHVDDDRDQMNTIVDRAKQNSKASAGADKGTALHRFTELWDNGHKQLGEYPAKYRPHLTAYEQEISESGFRVIPELTETVIINDPHMYAGQADRIMEATKQVTLKLPGGQTKRIKKGQRVLFDLKTGQIKEYKYIDFATQVCAYVNHNATWQVDHDHPDGGTRTPAVDNLRTDVAVIIHLRATDPNPDCALWTVDLDHAYQYLEHALVTRELRSAKVKRLLLGEHSRTVAPEQAAEAEVEPPTRTEMSERIERLSEADGALADVANRWPDGVAVPLPDILTVEQRTALDRAISQVEALHELPL